MGDTAAGREYPFIIGSAGHIDHGKTALVRALTGVDCDRLVEEKRRKITIELGFAPLLLPSGIVVSIIDVPGHERFIRQMAAGAAGVDAAMLVVAASEGVMPQTREHLDILRLLGATRGLVALSKTDLVDEETRELAQDEVRDLVRGTFLEDAPIIPVSSITGDGIPDLVAAIEELVANTKPRNRSGAFFLPIDRTFGIKGFGSVVTGTVYHGSLHEGEDVEIMPTGLRTKARGIQVHGAPSAEAVAGQRAAVNLASLSLDQLRRGDVVCAPDRFQAAECLDARLDVLASAPEPIRHWQRLRLHIGSSDTVARIGILGNLRDEKNRAIQPGGSALVQLLPESPLTAAAGERFILRSYSPLKTIAGGEILLPSTSRPRSSAERILRADILRELDEAGGNPAARLRALIREHGIFDENRLWRATQMEREEFDNALCEVGASARIVSFGKSRRFYCAAPALADIFNAVRDELAAFHARHPELAGATADDLSPRVFPPRHFDLDPRDAGELLNLFAASGKLGVKEAGGARRFHLPDFHPESGGFMEAVARVEELIDSKGFTLPDIQSLQQEAGMSPPELTRVLGYLKENAGLKIIGEQLLLSTKTREELLGIILKIDGDLTIGSLRDSIGASRKYALAILEFFDAQGITRRVGDKRIVLKLKG